MKRGGKDIESLDSLRSCPCSPMWGHGFRIRGDFICHRKSISLLKIRGFKRLSMNTGFVYRRIVFERSFANDILKEHKPSWLQYMDRFGYDKTFIIQRVS